MIAGRRILVVETDSHAGHKFGLLHPEMELWDEQPDGTPIKFRPEQTAVAKLAWELHILTLDTARRLAEGHPVSYIHLGDPTHGSVHPEQTITTRVADQIFIGEKNLHPVYEMLPTLKTARLIAGTGSHEFGEGTSALLISRMLSKEFPSVDTAPAFHGLYHVGGVLIDAAHHGPGQSSREWLNGNNARYYLKSLVDGHLKRQKDPPELTLRGHIHTPINEVITEWLGNRWVESRIVVCPPLSGLTEYARQVTRSTWEVVMGGLVIEIERAKVLRIHWVTSTMDVRTEEVL